MKIHLELIDSSAEDIAYLSLGYISLENGDKTITNKDRTPNQACMLFPSLALFMSQLEELEMRDRTEGEFIGIDASFELDLKLIGDELRISEYKREEIRVDIGVFAKELWRAYEELLKECQLESVRELGDRSEDLYLSALHYKITFAYALMEEE